MDYQSCPSPIKSANKSRRSQKYNRSTDQTEPNENRRRTERISSETSPLPKRAFPSGLAESFRAVFAAFLWHEGLVHDAMACSSYLKFHPSLPKRNALTFANDEIKEDVVHLSK